jgi:hypothetical protein
MFDATRTFKSFKWRDASQEVDGEGRGVPPGVSIPKPITLPRMSFPSEAAYRAFAQCWKMTE